MSGFSPSSELLLSNIELLEALFNELGEDSAPASLELFPEFPLSFSEPVSLVLCSLEFDHSLPVVELLEPEPSLLTVLSELPELDAEFSLEASSFNFCASLYSTDSFSSSSEAELAPFADSVLLELDLELFDLLLLESV